MITHFLEIFGLDEKEIVVYLELLKSGSIPASLLAKKTGLPRSTARYLCFELEKKGLVVVRKRANSFYFSAEPVEKIENLLHRERLALEEKERQAKELIYQLQKIANPDLRSQKWIKFYNGEEGLKMVYEDTLKDRQKIYAFENIESLSKVMESYILDDYLPRRIDLDIYADVISPRNLANERLRKDDSINKRRTKFLDPMLISSPFFGQINIYGNKAAFFSFAENNLYSFIIESATITSTLRAIFDVCWSVAD